jgi:hypothetical protein
VQSSVLAVAWRQSNQEVRYATCGVECSEVESLQVGLTKAAYEKSEQVQGRVRLSSQVSTKVPDVTRRPRTLILPTACHASPGREFSFLLNSGEAAYLS